MMKTKFTQSTSKKLAGYSAMAGAFVLMANGANAQLLYTDVEPDETYSGDGEFYELDLNNDGDVDFMFTVADFTYPGFFYSISDPTNTWPGLIRNVRIYSYNGSVGGDIGAYSTLLPYALNAGADINSDMQWNTSSAYGNQIMAFYLGVVSYPSPGSTYAFVTAGNWPGKSDKYIPLRLNDGGDSYYGWARLDVDDNCNEFTIKDYALKQTPDASIEAGETVGVFSVIQNDQLTAYSYGNTINVVVKDLQTSGATVKVFDIAGNIVYQNALDLSGMQITLAKVATGTYTLQVMTDEDGVYTKRVMITQ